MPAKPSMWAPSEILTMSPAERETIDSGSVGRGERWATVLLGEIEVGNAIPNVNHCTQNPSGHFAPSLHSREGHVHCESPREGMASVGVGGGDCYPLQFSCPCILFLSPLQGVYPPSDKVPKYSRRHDIPL